VYGPENLDGNALRLVGSYKNADFATAGTEVHGFLFEGETGDLGNAGSYRTIDVPGAKYNYVHSTMGGLVVGNYDSALEHGTHSLPLGPGHAYLYDIASDSFLTDIVYPGSLSNTAYGIWHNGGTSYTIAGGFSEGLSFTGLDQGYLVDWDSADQSTSNWRAYNFDDLPFEDAVSHFDGITGDGNGGYNLTGDYIGVGAENGLGFFASVRRTLGDSFGSAVWTQISYPSGTGLDVDVTSGNSVYENRVIGIYTANGEGIAQGYVAVVPEASASALAVTALAGILLLRRKRASVVAR
jgi:hypothetical protein